ncbi:hypothetical protein QL996_13445 [Planococcus sp. APC 4015]|nr:hypothetical protein [Planococcus sp. APC 4015]
MPSAKKIRKKVTRAVGSERLMRLRRASRENQTIDGFAVAVGAEWALLHRTMDGGFFDGHVAIRLDDIASVDRVSSFETSFARTQPEWPPAAPARAAELDLDTTSGMLASLLHPGELFGIERNKKYDAIWIGVPDELTRRWLYMWEVSPDASWHAQPSGYRLRTITMVRTNDHYQRGLTAIAGAPPVDPSSPPWGSFREPKK